MVLCINYSRLTEADVMHVIWVGVILEFTAQSTPSTVTVADEENP